MFNQRNVLLNLVVLYLIVVAFFHEIRVFIFSIRHAKDPYARVIPLLIIIDMFKGTYHINGVELPPKNFPFPYEKIDYRLNFKSISTKSKANIFEIYMEFKYIGPKRK